MLARGMFSKAQEKEAKAMPVTKAQDEKYEMMFIYGYAQVATSDKETISKIKDVASELWKLHVNEENEIEKKGFAVYDKTISCLLKTLSLPALAKWEAQINKDLDR